MTSKVFLIPFIYFLSYSFPIYFSSHNYISYPFIRNEIANILLPDQLAILITRILEVRVFVYLLHSIIIRGVSIRRHQISILVIHSWRGICRTQFPRHLFVFSLINVNNMKHQCTYTGFNTPPSFDFNSFVCSIFFLISSFFIPSLQQNLKVIIIV